jgi:hypothetical protein
MNFHLNLWPIFNVAEADNLLPAGFDIFYDGAQPVIISAFTDMDTGPGTV